MKKRNWVNIQDNQERTFIDLSEKTSDNTILESNKRDHSSNRMKVLRDTIIEAVLKLNNRVSMCESLNSDDTKKTWDDFKNIDQWKDFKNQAMMIGSYLSKNSDEIKMTLNQMEQDFKALSEKGDVNAGFKTALQIEKVLADSGIQSSASTKGVLPEIKAKNLIDIVAKKVDSTSKIDYDSINPQFMKKFIQ